MTHTSLPMFVAVTTDAKQPEIVEVKPKVGMRGPGLYVVHVEELTGSAALAFPAGASSQQAAKPAPFTARVHALAFRAAPAAPVRVQRSDSATHPVALATKPRLRTFRYRA